MKTLVALPIFAVSILGLAACQSTRSHHQNDFPEKTHRTYNPETGSFEQSPPFGKQGNKSGADQ